MSARDTSRSISRASTPTSDEDSSRALRIQRERYAELVRELQHVPEQISGAYRDAWQRFYLWEPQYCQDMLRSLRDATLPQRSAVPFSAFVSESFDLSDINDSMGGQGDDDSLSYQQWFCDDDGGSVSVFGVAEEVVVGSRDTPFTSYAYAKYEACTPALQNIKHESDMTILQFIPYADEPGFLRRIKSYAGLHAVFAWQHCWYDVDFKLIALEAAWHLHAAGLSPETVDKYEVAFFPSLGGQSGLIASMHHRDLIDWGGSLPSSQLSDLRRPQAHFLGRSVDNMTMMFCASMNCVESRCMLHRQPYPPFELPDIPKDPMGTELRKVCGPHCFRLSHPDDFEENGVVAVDQDIYEVLRLFPNKPSCQLAKLCKTTCINVFIYRQFSLKGETPNSFLNRDPNDWAGLDFCIHQGPCSVQSGCSCAKQGVLCQKRCRCQCSLKGCHCNICDDNCPCVQGLRECNPERCKHKKRKSKSLGKHHCSNTIVQAGKSNKLRVQLGSFGLGTFAEKDIPKNSLLGEYISERFSNLESEEMNTQIDLAVGKINRQRGLNYLFNVEQDQNNFYDAATVGDPTRYLNHPGSGVESNVTAAERNIDGDWKILFQTMDAQVRKDEELLLHYGETYWLEEVPSEDEEDPDL